MLTLCIAACALSAGEPESITFEWTTDAGERWTHAALIERPDRETDTGLGVMLFGGGLSADLHWTTPGSYEHDGETHRMTISGEDTRDADTLAAALLDAGFTVLRSSAVREGDPLHAENRAMAQAKPFPETVTMAVAAWGALLDRAELEPGEVFVVGHSLGVPRSLYVTEGRAAGYVMLAGAYVTPNRARTSALAEAAADEPGEDYDASGDIAGWERAASRAIRTGETRTAERFTSGGAEFDWACDVLAASEAPALAIWGGLDTISYHGPVLDHLLPGQVETVYVANRGHNLASEEDGLTGPIDPAVVERIVGWIAEHARE